jgi:hypothetical protein
MKLFTFLFSIMFHKMGTAIGCCWLWFESKFVQIYFIKLDRWVVLGGFEELLNWRRSRWKGTVEISEDGCKSVVVFQSLFFLFGVSLLFLWLLFIIVFQWFLFMFFQSLFGTLCILILNYFAIVVTDNYQKLIK